MPEGPTKSLFDSDVSPDELAIRGAAFKAILGGAPITRDGLVAATGLTQQKIDTLVEGLAKRGLIVEDPDTGQIVGSWGLSFVPTTHRLQIRGRTLHTWCAEDAVGIPAGLGEDARVLSSCHECGVPVKIEMVAGSVRQVIPPGVNLWVTAIEMGRSVVGVT
jgi:alkylmercury lyase